MQERCFLQYLYHFLIMKLKCCTSMFKMPFRCYLVQSLEKISLQVQHLPKLQSIYKTALDLDSFGTCTQTLSSTIRHRKIGPTQASRATTTPFLHALASAIPATTRLGLLGRQTASIPLHSAGHFRSGARAGRKKLGGTGHWKVQDQLNHEALGQMAERRGLVAGNL